MSLKEKLDQKRELKVEISKKQEQENIVAELAKIEEEKSLIAQKRIHLADAMAAFSMAYSEANKFNNTFKEKSEKLDKLMDEYGDVLKDIDINTKSELIADKEFTQEIEAEEYKISSRNRKEAVAKVAKLKATRPDLDFRGGKKEGEEKSPRELAMEALQKEVDELDLELSSLTEKEQELITEKDIKPEEFLIKLCREEMSKLSDMSYPNYDFRINNKPGFNLTYKVLDLGEKYGAGITKKLLQEKFEKEYSGGAREIEQAIDLSWAGALIRTELDKKELAPVKDYMEKKRSTEYFLQRITPYNPKEGQILDKNLNPDFLLKVGHDEYKSIIVYPDYENENKGSARVSEITNAFKSLSEKKINESNDILNKNIVFGANKKKKLARCRSNFYDTVKKAFEYSNYLPDQNSDFWKKFRKNRDEKIISDEEAQAIERMYQLKKKALDDLKKVREERNYVNSAFCELIPKNILAQADWLSEGVISLKDFKKSVEKYLEDLNSNAEKTDLASEAERVKKLFRDYSKALKKATSIRSDDRILGSIKHDAGRLIGYDSEIKL